MLKKIKENLHLYGGNEIALLIVLYGLARRVIVDIPYLNLLIINVEKTFFILWFIFLFFYKLSSQKILFFCVVLIISYGLSYAVGSSMDGEITGWILYGSLATILYKYLRNRE